MISLCAQLPKSAFRLRPAACCSSAQPQNTWRDSARRTCCCETTGAALAATEHEAHIMSATPASPRWTAGAHDCSAVGIRSHDHFLRILHCTRLPVVQQPHAAALQGRQTIRVQLGMTCNYFQGGYVSKDSRRAPRLTQAAFAWFARRFPGATATSCTIACNRQAPLHVDKNNIGASYLTCLGRFTGGALWVSGERRARTLALSRRQWHKFDSRWPHCGSHFRGERCYVSFYTHKAILRTAAAQKAELRRLGVPLPTQAAARACFRAAFAVNSRARWALANIQWASAGVALERPALEHRPSSWICWECGAFGSNTGFGRPRLHCCRNCKQQAYRRRCAER